jgi:hypothetical protein
MANKLECSWRDAGSDALKELRKRAGMLEGCKNDAGKPTFQLLPDDAMAAINQVLEFGTQNTPREIGKRAWRGRARGMP